MKYLIINIVCCCITSCAICCNFTQLESRDINKEFYYLFLIINNITDNINYESQKNYEFIIINNKYSLGVISQNRINAKMFLATSFLRFIENEQKGRVFYKKQHQNILNECRKRSTLSNEDFRDPCGFKKIKKRDFDEVKNNFPYWELYHNNKLYNELIEEYYDCLNLQIY